MRMMIAAPVAILLFLAHPFTPVSAQSGQLVPPGQLLPLGQGTFEQRYAQDRIQCEEEGGQVQVIFDPSRITDFNNDGVEDIITFGKSQFCRIPGQQGRYNCGVASCELTLYLSGPGGHRPAWMVNASDWMVQGGSRPTLKAIVGCNDSFNECEIEATWSAGAVRTRATGRRWPNHTAPSYPRAWTVSTLADGTRVAMSGWISFFFYDQVSLFCSNGEPILAVIGSRRIEPFTFGIETVEGNIEGTMALADGGAWVARISNAGVVELLTGDATEAVLRADGTEAGRLSLAGARNAIREALAPCLS